MEIKLLTTTNEKRLRKNLEEFAEIISPSKLELYTGYNDEKSRINKKEKFEIAFESFLEKEQKNIAIEMTKYVASAARLSRKKGTVLDVLEFSENKSFEENCNFTTMVADMGHDSIIDHDYLLFALKNISAIVEQTIIEERFSSFTIKSRREVNFKDAGFYIPDFHDINGNILPNNETLQEEYKNHMESLFKDYEQLINQDISKEDARFVLPYSYYSNIIMGINTHTLKDMIIKFTKTKYKNITELREFGERLYEIAKKRAPYIIPLIDKKTSTNKNSVEEYLNSQLQNNGHTTPPSYEIIEKTKLLNATSNIDDSILISALMHTYQFSYNDAIDIYNKLKTTNSNFKSELMKKIALETDDKLELTQVYFQFQIPISLAVLTHLTRHRTQSILTPDFAPVIDLKHYKTPPKIKESANDFFQNVFNKNYLMYKKFKNEYNVREEDLIYFTLSGNLVNIITGMNGKTLEHILSLRECVKCQWETREMAISMHKEIEKIAPLFSTVLGTKCKTIGICPEGKESCKLKKK